ncbi:uncharacterized protein [Leptinotarsa decemlineata]|uniref:uncharacterized protein n=1 Tax=Leptinotarsa decemlineata TaxID=7539 RepID=UPI003D3077D0
MGKLDGRIVTIETDINKIKKAMNTEVEEIKGGVQVELSKIKETISELQNHIVNSAHTTETVTESSILELSFNMEKLHKAMKDVKVSSEPGKLYIKPPQFDGKTPWANNRRQLEAATRANGWNAGEKSSDAKKSNQRPSWHEVAGYSPAVKSYWAQWNLTLENGVLKRVLESEDGGEKRRQTVVLRNRLREMLKGIHDGVTGGHLGVTKALQKEDSQKSTFRGESVKLRTPESDSSHHEDYNGTIRITVTDAISIKTKRSLIPIRVTSLPSTPTKNRLPSSTNHKLHKSAPNLNRSNSNSKIPLKKNSTVADKFNSTSGNKNGRPRHDAREHLVNEVDNYNSVSSNRSREGISPISPHREIEVFHNLTRSPERLRKPTIQALNIHPVIKMETDDSPNENACDNSSVLSEPHEIARNTKIMEIKNTLDDELIFKSESYNKANNSFQVCPETFKSTLPTTPSIVKTGESEKDMISNNPLKFSKDNYKISSGFHNRRCDENESSNNVVPLQQSDAKECAMSAEISENVFVYDSFQVFPYINRAEDRSRLRSPTRIELPLIKNSEMRKEWIITSIVKEENFFNKAEALTSLIKMLKQSHTCETLEPDHAVLLFEALFSFHKLDKLHYLAEDALVLVVNGLRVNVLEQCLGKLAMSLSKMGSPIGVSTALLIMKKCQAKTLQKEIMNRCFVHKMREGALQILMAATRMLPSSDVEITRITEFAASVLRDRRRRVRHAALETLAILASQSSTSEVLNIVDRIHKGAPDHDYLVRVVRTRLSRRQLPSVEVNGTVIYSTPHEKDEVEWLSEIRENSSSSSSASSSTHSVNYWKHNSRHDGNEVIHENSSSIRDDGASENQQIWAVDSSIFPRTTHSKNYSKGDPSILKPVYFLQPETVTDSGRGYRRYDRGRSFSPHKPHHKPFPEVAGSASQHNDIVDQSNEHPRQFKYNDGFRKSFSSEQLHYSSKPHQEPHSASLSSGSSTTSTGSSIKTNGWHREMRSGIPIPISSEAKLRVRTNTNMNTNTTVGPVIARRSAVGTTLVTPITPRLSPRDNSTYSNDTRGNTPPPRSSGSESSGYFTPPTENRAFVKLDSEARSSESDDKDDSIENDKNNNSQDCLNPVNNEVDQRDETVVIKSPTISEGFRNVEGEVIKHNELEVLTESDVSEDKFKESRRFSISSSKELSFVASSSCTDKMSKSRSAVDFQSFLPEIPKRKSACSAPPLKDELNIYKDLIITSYEDITVFPEKIASIESVVIGTEENEIVKSPKEISVTRKLSRRLSRTPSRRSTKSTPRSVRDLTPKSTAIKPKDCLQTALAQINNQEWEVMIQGLQGLTKLAKSHPDVLEANIHNVCVCLARQIKNLRSQVARSACHTASEIFQSCKKGLEMELEEVAGPLLHRTADTNKFLRADANAALDVMCEQLPPIRVILVLTSRGCNHQNNIVRSASMRLMTNVVKKLGADKIFSMNKEFRDRVILAGANSLGDGSLEARNHGKMLFSCLITHPHFQKILIETVPQNTLRHIAKTLNSIKPHPGT